MCTRHWLLKLLTVRGRGGGVVGVMKESIYTVIIVTITWSRSWRNVSASSHRGKELNLNQYALLLKDKCIFVLAESVHRHMQQYEVEYLQFAFRWMNNLLMRELPLRCTIRLWDTYQVQTLTAEQLLFVFLLSVHFNLSEPCVGFQKGEDILWYWHLLLPQKWCFFFFLQFWHCIAANYSGTNAT